MRIQASGMVLLLLPFALLSGALAQTEKAPKPVPDVSFTLSPLFGYNRDTVETGAPVGPTTLIETRPEYGIFLMLRAPHLRVSNFLFYTDPNDAQVVGNFLFANYYLDDSARLTANLGLGHLYHWIGMDRGNVVVSAPLVKCGPVVRIPEIGLSINPFAGFVWEQISSPYGDSQNNDWLYGLGLNWRWRMLGASVTYYIQHGGGDRDDLQTLRAYLQASFSRQWGGIVRFDYMEHTTTDDVSLLIGPTLTF